jgi:hypothetical protein
MTCSLTLKGLVLALHDQPELWKNIDDIVLKHRLIGPLVFKKWDQFVKAGARNVVVFRLKDAINSRAKAYDYPPDREYGADDIEYIDDRVLRMDTVFVGEVFSGGEIASFISVLSTDPDLESFVIEHNKEDIKSTAMLLEEQKAYDEAIRQNRPELFLSKLKHRAPLPEVKVRRIAVRKFKKRTRP